MIVKKQNRFRGVYASLFILAVILAAVTASSCRQIEKAEPEIEYQLHYRILYDENLSGEELLALAEQHDYDIVFFNEAQLIEAGEGVKDIANNRLAVFMGLSINRANEYLKSDNSLIPSDCNVTASCYSVLHGTLTGETGVCGEFEQPLSSRIELIESVSSYWHECQMMLLEQKAAAANQ